MIAPFLTLTASMGRAANRRSREVNNRRGSDVSAYFPPAEKTEACAFFGTKVLPRLICRKLHKPASVKSRGVTQARLFRNSKVNKRSGSAIVERIYMPSQCTGEDWAGLTHACGCETHIATDFEGGFFPIAPKDAAVELSPTKSVSPRSKDRPV